MPKKYIIGLLVIIIALGYGGYWLYGHKDTKTPAIVALPPTQALGFVALPGLPQAWADLQASKFFQQVSSPAFWQRALGPAGYQRLMEEIDRMEKTLGLPINDSTLNLLLGREIGLAVVPSPVNTVDVIVYARLSAGEKLAERLAQTFSGPTPDVVRETQWVDGIEVVTLRPKDGRNGGLSYAFLGTLAVLSSDRAWVLDAINARHGTTPDRLYSTAALQAMQLESTESLLGYGYYNIEHAQTYAMSELRWDGSTPAGTPLQTLPSAGKLTLKARRADDGLRLETMTWLPTHAVTQVLRQVEYHQAIAPFPGVPAQTLYLTHVDLFDLPGLWQLLRRLAMAVDRQAFQQMLSQFRASAGVDLERDVLPLFTGVGGLGITAPLGTQAGGLFALPGVFLTFGITDASKGQQLIHTIGTHVAGPVFADLLQERRHDSHTIYYLGNPLLFANPGYVISGQQLIVGSDVSLLQHMLDADSGKTTRLSATDAYQHLRKYVHLRGGSMTYVDVSAAVQEAQQVWSRLGGLILALTHQNSGTRAKATMQGDVWALLELLRPIHYVGVASQAEAQGVRTEAVIVMQDLP